jgi:hypothetical protein
MKIMRRLIVVFVTLTCFGGPAFAANGWMNNLTVTGVTASSGFVGVLTTGGTPGTGWSGTLADCGTSGKFVFTNANVGTNVQQMFSLLMAAFLAGKKINVYAVAGWGCTDSGGQSSTVTIVP